MKDEITPESSAVSIYLIYVAQPGGKALLGLDLHVGLLGTLTFFTRKHRGLMWGDLCL